MIDVVIKLEMNVRQYFRKTELNQIKKIFQSGYEENKKAVICRMLIKCIAAGKVNISSAVGLVASVG